MKTTVVFCILFKFAYYLVAIFVITAADLVPFFTANSKLIIINKVISRIIRRVYKDIIFDTKPIARKVYKNSENRTFLAVFAVFVVIRLAPSDPTRSVADTVDVAPVRLAQGIIK